MKNGSANCRNNDDSTDGKDYVYLHAHNDNGDDDQIDHYYCFADCRNGYIKH